MDNDYFYFILEGKSDDFVSIELQVLYYYIPSEAKLNHVNKMSKSAHAYN